MHYDRKVFLLSENQANDRTVIEIFSRLEWRKLLLASPSLEYENEYVIRLNRIASCPLNLLEFQENADTKGNLTFINGITRTKAERISSCKHYSSCI